MAQPKKQTKTSQIFTEHLPWVVFSRSCPGNSKRNKTRGGEAGIREHTGRQAGIDLKEGEEGRPLLVFQHLAPVRERAIVAVAKYHSKAGRGTKTDPRGMGYFDLDILTPRMF